MPELFIGVVSHERTRFRQSQGPHGLAARLAERLSPLGHPTTVHVNTQDLWDPATFSIDTGTVRDSLRAQRQLDAEWARFLSDEGADERSPLERVARWVRYQQHRVRPPKPDMVRRLVNIELSHLDLLQRGLASGSGWILILEDDAESADIDDCAAGIAGLITASGPQPLYVNVSESFPLKRLGVAHLMRPAAATWRGSVRRAVLESVRPTTNTVCAVLYRADFARVLAEELRSRPMEPVVPIDWRLNVILMDLSRSGRLSSGDCWYVDPGPIAQMSMR